MADEENNPEDEPGKKRFPVKTLGILGIAFVAQVLIIVVVYMLFATPKPSIAAEGMQQDKDAEDLQLVEVLLIGDKFQNTRQGAQSYLYDTQIIVIVRQRDRGYVEEQIKLKNARISADITEIFARAEPTQLNEPDRNTIRRQILERCQSLFGRVPGGAPEPSRSQDELDKIEKQKLRDKSNDDYYVIDVVIPRWKRFSTDS